MVDDVGCLFLRELPGSFEDLEHLVVGHELLEDVNVFGIDEEPIQLDDVRVLHKGAYLYLPYQLVLGPLLPYELPRDRLHRTHESELLMPILMITYLTA